MTGVGKFIYNTLNVTAINDLVDSRIYPVVAPNDESKFPCIVYEINSTEQVNTKDRLDIQADGSKGRFLETVTVSIYSLGYEYSQVENIENEIRKILDGYRGTVSGVNIDGVLLQDSSDNYNYDIEIFEKETIYNIRVNY